jgi:hypothetical protein
MQAIEEDLGRLTANLTECQFQAPPLTGGWSIGHCIEHLTLIGNGFLVEWDAALKNASAKGIKSEGPFPYSFLQRSILKFAEPPSGMKVKAPKAFVPCSRRPMDETLRRFQKMQYGLAHAIASSRGFDAARIKVKSPCLAWICYPLGMSFDLALAHERRHLWQAWQIRKQFTGQEKCA